MSHDRSTSHLGHWMTADNEQLTTHATSCSVLILLVISAAVKTASIVSACTSPVSVGVVVMSTRCGFN